MKTNKLIKGFCTILKSINLKKKFIIIPIILITILYTGCKKEVTDEYYVKYIVSTSSLDEKGKIMVIFKNEKEEEIKLTMKQGLYWETIIGPVTKGFKANLEVLNKTAIQGLHVYSEIDISKNNNPFTYKVSDGPQLDIESVVNTILRYEIE